MPTAEERIRELIREGGPITFARFMDEALYGEAGYYRQEVSPIGLDGDYVTGSSLSPMFGRATARLLLRLDAALGGAAELLEVGCGAGTHLAAVAAVAGEGRTLRGLDKVQRPLAGGIEVVSNLDGIPDDSVDGLIFSYELFDALPVHRLVQRPSGPLGELWVDVKADESFIWREGPLSDPELEEWVRSSGVPLLSGQVADFSPEWAPLYRSLAGKLRRGLLVTCDYGMEVQKLLDARVRPFGSLACYRHHQVHRNPFVEVGQQDLTAHVDFTTLRRAGEAVGLETICLTRQAPWLTASGLFEELEDADLETRAQAMALLDPEGMGDEIRVLVQGRDLGVEGVLDRIVLQG